MVANAMVIARGVKLLEYTTVLVISGFLCQLQAVLGCADQGEPAKIVKITFALVQNGATFTCAIDYLGSLTLTRY